MILMRRVPRARYLSFELVLKRFTSNVSVVREHQTKISACNMEGRVEEQARQNARNARMEAAVLRVRARRQEESNARIEAERIKTEQRAERVEELRVRLRRRQEDRNNDPNHAKNTSFEFEYALWRAVRWMFMIIFAGIVTVVMALYNAVPVVFRFMCDLFRLVCSLVGHLVAMLNPPASPAPASPAPATPPSCAICFECKELSSDLSVCGGCGNTFHTHCIDQMQQGGDYRCPCCRWEHGIVPIRW